MNIINRLSVREGFFSRLSCGFEDNDYLDKALPIASPSSLVSESQAKAHSLM